MQSFILFVMLFFSTFSVVSVKPGSGSDWLYDEKGRCRTELQMFCNPTHKSMGAVHIIRMQEFQYITDEITYTFYSKEGNIIHFRHADVNDNFFEPPWVDDITPTKILVHGIKVERAANEKLKDAYLEKMPEANVLTVNWEVIKNKILTPLTGNGAFLLATCLGEVIKKLFPSRNLNNVHIIGHGISAHAAGVAGRQLQDEGLLLQRITGLDAANPYLDNGLNKHDAYFVDVIHTNAESLIPFQIIGHADFYPNGGKGHQPDCSTSYLPPSACNTWMAYEYYEATLANPYRFIAVKCADVTELEDEDCSGSHTYMGEYIDFGARGVYYIKIDAILKKKLQSKSAKKIIL